MLSQSDEIYFFNSYYGSNGWQALDFKFTDVQFSDIAELLVKEKGTFNIIGQFCWINSTINTKGKRLRGAVVADEAGHIVISFWEEIIDQLNENKSCIKVFNVSFFWERN